MRRKQQTGERNRDPIRNINTGFHHKIKQINWKTVGSNGLY